MTRKFDWGRDLVVTRGARGAINTACLKVGGPRAHNPRPIRKELIFCLLWFTKGSRVGDIAKVLV
jgi:hypothetical protein